MERVLMPDLSNEIADRLDRAADRMSNSGFLDEERRYRRAAARIRAGLSPEETQKLERQMLIDPQPAMLHRLDALAAPGEYDDPDAPGVDTDFISKNEGDQQLQGYVPDPDGSKSGVTVGTGVDLGQLSQEQLDAMDLSQALKDQLTPYIGLTGQDAVTYLNEHPLEIGETDATALDSAVLDPIISQVGSYYNSSGATVQFASLPPQAQTAIADLAVQFGPNLASATPNFWGDVTKGDWDAAITELRTGFGTTSADRRGQEANLLQQAIDNGTLPGTKSTTSK